MYKRDLYTDVLIRVCQVFVGGLAWLKSCIVKSCSRELYYIKYVVKSFMRMPGVRGWHARCSWVA